MKRDFYVYAYLDTRKPGKYDYGKYEFDYEPFYIGYGQNERMFDHLKEASGQIQIKNVFKTNKIKAIWKLGLEPRVEFVRNDLSLNDAKRIEIEIINLIGRKAAKSGVLTNITAGGDGGDTFTNNPNKEEIRKKQKNKYPNRKGVRLSEETKKKISQSKKGQRKGISFSEEHKERISQSKKGISFSKEHKKNLSKSRRQRITTDETKDKMRHSMLGKNGKIFRLKNAKGEIFETTNGLASFCRDNNLNYDSFRRTVIKKKGTMSGWHLIVNSY